MKTLTVLALAVVLCVDSSKGEFYNHDVLWRMINWFLPNSLVEQNVFFYLYTRANLEVPEQLWVDNKTALAGSHFDVAKRTLIIIHGFDTNYTAASAQGPKQEYLAYNDVNVITPDFGNINSDPAFLFFYTAAKSYRIGRFLGKLVVFLIDQGANPDEIHIIGHSLGAHIAGFAGKYAKSKGKQIGRVTGLDPCYPIYNGNGANYRLDSEDAKFTDCIYTSYGHWGVGIPVCQANFFPNGVGLSQPGCYHEDLFQLSICGHSRVVEYFIESINPQSAFHVKECDGVPGVERPTRCWSTTRTLMGGHANRKVTGMFYLKTNAKSPYSKG